MRGYFAVGAEGLSKTMNFGNLLRSAHAFGASFFFTVDALKRIQRIESDTSNAPAHLPYFDWHGIDEMALPKGCKLVGIELTDDAIDLPSFGHPVQAAYILGPEKGTLSPAMLERCDHIIKIPTSFCINVATAGAIVMYDRAKNLGSFAERPVSSGAPKQVHPKHVHGMATYEGGRIIFPG